MSKYADTRIVTFKEDYTIPTKGGGKRVLYKKDSVHAIHKTVVAKLEGKAQMKVEELDYKKVIEQKKKELQNQRKKAVELAYSA